MAAGFITSGVLCFVVSLCTHNIKTKEDAENEWTKTVNIDNPLHPFRLVYKEELEEIRAGPIITSATMDRIFVKAKRIAYYGGGFCLSLFVIVIPCIAVSYPVLTPDQLKAWMRTIQAWCFVGTVLVVVVPPIEEGVQIWRKYKENKASKREVNSDGAEQEINDIKL